MTEPSSSGVAQRDDLEDELECLRDAYEALHRAHERLKKSHTALVIAFNAHLERHR